MESRLPERGTAVRGRKYLIKEGQLNATRAVGRTDIIRGGGLVQLYLKNWFGIKIFSERRTFVLVRVGLPVSGRERRQG